MEENSDKLKLATKSADKWFFRIFGVGFILSFFGNVDFLFNPILRSFARQEMDWFSRFIFDVMGPENPAQILRSEELFAFSVFSAVFWFITAFLLSILVLLFKMAERSDPDCDQTAPEKSRLK